MRETCSFEAEVTEQDVEAFAQLSGDHNPLHTDANYARTTEYGRPIAHGALLVGFVSRVMGMYIPGRECVILSLKVQFPKPLFYPSRVQVKGELKQFNSERSTGSVHVVIVDLTKGWSVLDAEVFFTLHAAKSTSYPTGDERQSTANTLRLAPKPSSSSHGGGRPRLLVTGGTGGMGLPMLPALAVHYDLCCVTRKSESVSLEVRAEFHQVDLEEPGAWERYLAQQDPGSVYGIVHLSAAPLLRAFVSDDVGTVKRQWRHAVEVPLLAAQWARQPGSSVKRIVLLGSTAGSTRPQPHYGAYSLGKATMEHLARLLTADLSAQGATVNVVAPTALPVGMHEGMSERTRKALIGKMPTGRMVEPRDIAAVILFALSESASQVNGATLVVDGGLAE